MLVYFNILEQGFSTGIPWKASKGGSNFELDIF